MLMKNSNLNQIISSLFIKTSSPIKEAPFLPPDIEISVLFKHKLSADCFKINFYTGLVIVHC
jgi:hypothetical protein